MRLTSVFSDIEMSKVLEVPSNIAISAGPLGTPFVQLLAVFQSPEMGSIAHWVLIAYATAGRKNIREQRIAARISVFIVISGCALDARDYRRSEARHAESQYSADIDVKF